MDKVRFQDSSEVLSALKRFWQLCSENDGQGYEIMIQPDVEEDVGCYWVDDLTFHTDSVTVSFHPEFRFIDQFGNVLIDEDDEQTLDFHPLQIDYMDESCLEGIDDDGLEFRLKLMTAEAAEKHSKEIMLFYEDF